jgi:uncharacterized protein YfkK (UPF0435 family)
MSKKTKGNPLLPQAEIDKLKLQLADLTISSYQMTKKKEYFSVEEITMIKKILEARDV